VVADEFLVGIMIRLAIPGMIMVEAEYVAFEVLTFASSQFGAAELAAQAVLLTLASIMYQLPFSISVASSTRVANLIGAGLVDAAKTSAKVVGTPPSPDRA
jgi:MATE family multidrug resistance protein